MSQEEKQEQTTDKTVKFYRAEGSYGCFSNFSKHSIQLKGKFWPTVEHYFQALKFAETPQEYVIRNCSTPKEAKKLGNDRNGPYPIRKDWEKVKESIMYEGLYAKFTQHKDIQQILLDTKDANIEEHTTKDNYWGNGGNGSGKNRLGVLLMKVREDITKNPPKEESSETNNNQSLNTNGSSDDSDSEGEPTGSAPLVKANKVSKKKRKNRARKDVWKDGGGRSLFTIDNESKNSYGVKTVSLEGGNSSIPITALPPMAKTIAVKNQYARQWENEEDEEYDDEDQEDEGVSEYIYKKNNKNTLGDYLPSAKNTKKEYNNFSTPESCIQSATVSLELLKSLPLSDEESIQDVKHTLSQIESSIVVFIENNTIQSEKTLSQLFVTLEEIRNINKN